ncbi:hypothetical protein QFZ84_003547 [Pseudomonas fluorescens]
MPCKAPRRAIARYGEERQRRMALKAAARIEQSFLMEDTLDSLRDRKGLVESAA